MKKVFLYLTFFIFLLIPINVNSQTLREGITNYYIDATVLENGDLHIKELFVLNGEFNGFERIINYINPYAPGFDGSINSFRGSDIYNADDIELLSIKNINIDENVNFDYLYHDGDKFYLVSGANLGDYGKYTVAKRYNGYVYRIYNPSRGKKRGFYIEYILKKLAISHADIAEIGWNLFSDELTEYVNNFEMIINIPNNQNELRVWGHGPLNGYTEIINKNKIRYVINELNKETAIDIRFVFDKDVIKTSKTTNVMALDKILEVEKEWAEEANYQRQMKGAEAGELEGYNNGYQDGYNDQEYDDSIKNADEWNEDFLNAYQEKYVEAYKRGYDDGHNQLIKERRIAIILNVLNVAWLLFLGWLINFIYQKYDKEYASSFKGKYYRDFPKPYGPEIVGYLFRRKITNNDLSASILNLIAKKEIIFEKLEKNDYLLKRNTEKEVRENLSEAEKYLINWLFARIGKDGTVKIKDIQNEAKRNYDGFLTSYNNWKDMAKEEAIKEDFFESHANVKVLSVLYSILGFCLALFAYLFPTEILLTTLVFLGSIASFIYFLSITKRTKKGNEDYRRWLGLKNFLKDFGRFETRDLPHIHLWEKYLVYAVVFGCAKKLAKTMKIKFAEMQAAGYTPMDAMFDIHYINMITNFNTTINNSINNAMSSKVAAESRSSSSGGFGGGFSGGGGSFGGGGGGGRF
ncbi:MAG: DUF2207 domain-containing protein [Mollicutes bacterium]|nr:DUF2207 domain-containing protein [Mollicutes bacterium]